MDFIPIESTALVYNCYLEGRRMVRPVDITMSVRKVGSDHMDDSYCIEETLIVDFECERFTPNLQ